VDGVTASAILYPTLKKLGAEADVYIPQRLGEGYGLNQPALEKLLKKKISLVITADNGITGLEPIKFLKEKSVDTIVVDHHIPKNTLPPAVAIVSAVIGEKGDPHLAACGLAFKLAWALSGSLESVKEYLDLVAVGTVADLAPVIGENRILLRHGLAALANTQRKGLRALMDAAGISPKNVSHRDIAFGLGPRINASGRMGSPENAFKLLVTDNELEAQNLAQILEDGNRDRQRVEAAAFEEAVERVELEGLHETEKIFVLDNPDWHQGVLGIVAARLVERYQRPSIVLSVKNGVAKGSGRSTAFHSIFDSVLSCEGLLESFGGHAQACGLTIKEENIAIFRKKLNEAFQEEKDSSRSARTLAVESELAISDLDMKFLQDLEKLSPFGPGNKKPLFLSRALRVKGLPKKRGKDTLQCWVSDASGKTTCELIGFRMYGRWQERPATGALDIVYQPALKYFNGISSIELQLEDWRASTVPSNDGASSASALS